MSDPSHADIGVVGLGVMGANLARNLDRRAGKRVVVHDREAAQVDRFLSAEEGRSFLRADDLAGLAARLESPRRILVMVPAGAPVDAVLDALAEVLEAGDVVIDGGNSHYKETMAREARYRSLGLHFVGMGVSGGAQGALHGPSLMPGGSQEAWSALRGLLEPIAAESDAGPCVGHVGPDGAGHFVKMVHNGIEYADMQAIAEVVDVLRRIHGLTSKQAAGVFAAWHEGPLESFLVGLTARVLATRDPKDPSGERALVDSVLDRAGQKGTGRWTVAEAVERGVATPSISAALDARVLSSKKPDRVAASEILRGPLVSTESWSEEAAQASADALLAARLAAMAQGMDLVGVASEEEGWAVDRAELARLWRAGCILRARTLDDVRTAYTAASPANLLVAPRIAPAIGALLPGLRQVVALAARHGIPTPVLSASLAYVDAYRTADLPQNVTQAQRDAFGGHTYVRRDDPEGRPVHSEW